jgi:NAD(P)H-hydrate repair Nnr-like enzyme with NAD(P)H-hydrate dehydratase domain
MNQDFWYKQTAEQPLFPDLIWSRPESRALSGKLLIIGGNLHSFALTASAYNQAEKAGAGAVKVLMPDAIKTLLGPAVEATLNIEFAPSTPSGSFSQKALDEFLALSQWADTVLLIGELGRNSETAILLEKFVEKYKGLLIISGDSLDYFTQVSPLVLDRPDTCLAPDLSQLQKLAAQIQLTLPITSNMDLLRLVDALHDLSSKHPAYLIFRFGEYNLVAVNGRVSSTKSLSKAKDIQADMAVQAAIWWMQAANRPFEAITSSMLKLS